MQETKFNLIKKYITNKTYYTFIGSNCFIFSGHNFWGRNLHTALINKPLLFGDGSRKTIDSTKWMEVHAERELIRWAIKGNQNVELRTNQY